MATRTQKTKVQAEKLVESEEFYGALSIATIAKRVDLDRATVKKRLDELKKEPLEGSTQKLKLYQFDEVLEAELLEKDTKNTEARTQKEQWSAKEKEIKVKQMMGELAPVAEFKELIGLFSGGLYKELCVRMPKRLAARLARATTAADAESILAAESDRVFQDVRSNYAKYLGETKARKAA